jgi:hypothetical protein
MLPGGFCLVVSSILLLSVLVVRVRVADARIKYLLLGDSQFIFTICLLVLYNMLQLAYFYAMVATV